MSYADDLKAVEDNDLARVETAPSYHGRIQIAIWGLMMKSFIEFWVKDRPNFYWNVPSQCGHLVAEVVSRWDRQLGAKPGREPTIVVKKRKVGG